MSSRFFSGRSNLAREKRIANVVLEIDKIPGENVRQGFLEEHVYCAIRAKLPPHQVPLFTVAYYTGIRAGELLNLKWQYIDFFAAIPLIKIPGQVTKNGKPRTIPLYCPEMVETLKFAYQTRNVDCPWMFQFKDKKLKSYRQGWRDACVAAGYPDVLFHDTRRTAVRNMERAGVRRTDARQISGHLTESVYQRYDIGSEQGAFEAAEKLGKFHAEQQRKKIVDQSWIEPARERSAEESAIAPKSLN
jgi:integrase